MPTKDSMIQFKYGIQSNYDKITTKDLNTVYFTTDSQRLFVGDTEYTRPIQHGTSLPTGFVPPNSFFYHETEKALYFSKDGEAWVACSNFYVHPTFTAKTYGPSNDDKTTLDHGDTFKVPQITVNTEGHVSAGKEIIFTLPSAPDITIDAKDPTAATQLAFGEEFTLIESDRVDAATDGHKIIETRKKYKLPAAPADIKNTTTPAGDGNAVTDVAFDKETGHILTVTKGETFATKASVDAIAEKPAMSITSEKIASWDGEVGAKAAAQAAQTTANAAVVANDAITGATHTKITYDEKGLVTGGADLAATDIPNLDAAKITTGTFVAARIPNLSADKITSGTLGVARIPDLTLSKITDAGTAAAKDVATAAIGTTATDDLVTGNQVKSYVDTQVAGLSGAMHFVGQSTTDPKGSTGATVDGHTKWAAGDVVLFGNKEFVLKSATNTADNWIELGDETRYAVKGEIKNDDIADDAAIDQFKISGLVDTLAAKATPANIDTKITQHVTDHHKTLTIGTETYDGSEAVEVNKATIGLGNVDNTADSEKSVASAAKLTTSRTIAISGAVTGTATAFDGTKNITIATTSVDGSQVNGAVAEATHATTADSATSADSATKATQDEDGKNIKATYATKAEVTASTLVWDTF